MATVVNEGDVFLARIEYSDGSNNKAYNLLHYRVKDINPPVGSLYVPQPVYDVAPALAEEVGLGWYDNWKNFASNRASVQACMVQSISPPPKSAAYTYQFAAGAGDGLVIDEMLPFQDALTILKRTALGSRRGLGRVFVPGIPENAQASGVISVAAETLLSGLVTEVGLLKPVTVFGIEYVFEPVLYSEGPPGTFVTTPIINTALSDRVIKTQRRRRPGKGI